MEACAFLQLTRTSPPRILVLFPQVLLTGSAGLDSTGGNALCRGPGSNVPVGNLRLECPWQQKGILVPRASY